MSKGLDFKAGWVNINKKIFNLDKVLQFSVIKNYIYENVWDVFVSFVNGHDIVIAQVNSEDDGFQIIKDIFEFEFALHANKTTPKPVLDKKPESKTADEIPF